MACPLFEPTEKLPWERWKGRFRPPLGAPYAGRCHAEAAPDAAPDALLLDCCNMGSAHGRCERFNGDGPEAMRFEISDANEETVEVAWLAERDCLPAAQGRATYDRAAAQWLGVRQLALPLQRQLDAYVQAWLSAGGPVDARAQL